MRVSLLVVVTGCGFGANVPSGGPSDALPQPDVAVDGARDAAPDAPAPVTCWSRWLGGSVTFSGATALTALNSTTYDRDPSISPDGLALFWSSTRTPSQGADVWTAVRPTPTGTFATAALRADANTSADETRLSLTADGLIAAIGSSRNGTEGSIDVFLATRASTEATFGAFDNALLTAVNDGDAQHDPFLSGDGLRLYLAPAAGGQHIAVATRATIADAFAAPTSLIDSGAGDADPTLSPDERVIVFASRRAGSAASDLWFATRASPSEPFGAPIPLPAPANSSADDGDPALSADGCELYFASTRAGGLGDYDLYVVSITP